MLLSGELLSKIIMLIIKSLEDYTFAYQIISYTSGYVASEKISNMSARFLHYEFISVTAP